MRTVWRWGIHPGMNDLNVPAGTEWLYANLNTDGEASVWGLVPDADAPKTQQRLLALGTGTDFPPDCTARRYVGTAVANGPPRLPWALHVFVVEEGR